ncbi:MAG TPA: ATP-grasp domain-containing protein, partial [Elusimicrobiota bacterium]|nr:ATP-grasp domain-containing protein [Elusimicrobiota bacterium]
MGHGKAKWLHVLGGGEWQLPTIRRARELGYRVLVTDIYAERPGYAIADRHEVIDIRDADRTLEAARRHAVSGIICDTTDVGVPTAALVAETLGLRGIGYQTALDFTHKDRMREKTSAAGIDGPWFRLARTPAEALSAARAIGLPVIVKPPDSQSSRGVTCVWALESLLGAFETACRHSFRHEALIEQYISGTEITVEALCWGGRVEVLGISDKKHFAAHPQIASQLVYPADFPLAVMAEIEDANRRTVECLGLAHGVTHAEYIVNERGVFLVEIAARGGGNRIHSHIAPYLSGIDVPRLMIEWTLGESVELPSISRRG